MADPREVLTSEGFRDYLTHLRNIENGLFFILNHASDLEIEPDDMDAMYAMQQILESKRLEGA